MFKINGWTIHHDGFTWWTTREGDEPRASTSYLDAQAWALANRRDAAIYGTGRN